MDTPLGVRDWDDISDLTVGLDFRRKEYRREVWLQFYEFHLRYRAHPGCVYFLIPYLREKFSWDEESTLWFAYLNGNTQNPITSLLIHSRFPSMNDAEGAIEFWKANYERFEWDTDRRYHKSLFDKAVLNFVEKVKPYGSASVFWRDAASRGFSGIWERARGLNTFGRLSAFSFSEYLRIAGVPFDCDNLFLEDISGSRSHRDGICVVAGMDSWVGFLNPSFDGKWPPNVLQWLDEYARELLKESRVRAKGKPWENDVSLFTLESALCTYKSWHKPNRRYPNVYNDMFFNRIRRAERQWPEEDLSVFWEARKACLPTHLRVEDCPGDPGLDPRKQNHYLKTGQVIMMSNEYPHFANDFEAREEDVLDLFG